jgi:hypothetical protein
MPSRLRIATLAALLLAGSAATAAPPSVVVVPPPKAGEWTDLKVAAGEIVKLEAQPASEWESYDGPQLHVFDNGRYAVCLLTPGERRRVVVTGPDKSKARYVLVGDSKPDDDGKNPPKPPADPLKAKLKAAYDADASESKGEDRKNLAALYRAATDRATTKNKSGEYADATIGSLLKAVQETSDSFVGTDALPGIRQVAREELNRLFASDGPLDDASRKKLGDLLGRLAEILEGF